jgi:hypothetical protein
MQDLTDESLCLARDRQDFRERERTEPTIVPDWHPAIGREQFTCTTPVRNDENQTRSVKLSTGQFTIGNARVAMNGLLHKNQTNQLVSILQKRIPPHGDPDSHPCDFGRLRKKKQNENLCDW